MHGAFGFLGYPTSDVKTSSDRRSRYSNLERGPIYLRPAGATETTAPSFSHEQLAASTARSKLEYRLRRSEEVFTSLVG